eukprot:INCI20178.1.p1 GENE.INCI20178.1~~INCI20178.1.p1  ORF type:complete len:188 (-),score=19.90 INCI20178.1:253-816(-)
MPVVTRPWAGSLGDWARQLSFFALVLLGLVLSTVQGARIDALDRGGAVLTSHLRRVPADPAKPKPGADTIAGDNPSTTTSSAPVNVAAIMFGPQEKHSAPPGEGDVVPRFAENKASVEVVQKADVSQGAGAASDPWWLNPPPWWLPPPPEWGAAPVSMYSSFYNPGNVQTPRPDRVPSSFAPYPIMT